MITISLSVSLNNTEQNNNYDITITVYYQRE